MRSFSYSNASFVVHGVRGNRRSGTSYGHSGEGGVLENGEVAFLALAGDSVLRSAFFFNASTSSIYTE